MLDAVAESASLDFLSIFNSILLRAKHDGIATILSIDTIDDFIKPPLLLRGKMEDVRRKMSES